MIDKDLTSSLLATQLNADVFAIATEVEHVFVDYQKPTQRKLETVTAEECRKYFKEGQFPAGSMGPKVKAALLYLERGGKHAIITDLEHLFEAIEGNAGTHMFGSIDDCVPK